MRKSLRTEAQGADTIVWLSAAKRVAEETGKYWFDRYVHAHVGLLFLNPCVRKYMYSSSSDGEEQRVLRTRSWLSVDKTQMLT